MHATILSAHFNWVAWSCADEEAINGEGTEGHEELFTASHGAATSTPAAEHFEGVKFQ